MPARFGLRAILLLAALLLSAAQDGQTPTLRITVTLVQVDAVVTDSKGTHVADLTPDDFELSQDGEVQKITHFAYIPAPENTPEPPSKRTAGKAPPGPPTPVTASQVKRTVALVVDDLALSFENVVRVRDSLRKYVEQQMQPGDLMAIVRTGGGVAVLEQFTTDKRVLLAGIDLLKWRFNGRTGLIPINPISTAAEAASPSSPQILDYGYTLSALGALGTLEQVVKGMKGLPGRKSIVFLSEALRLNSEVNSALDHLTDLSNRAGVSLYAIDPSGLRTKSSMAEESEIMSTSSASTIHLDDLAVGQESSWSQEGLSNLAKRTGGLFFSNRNDISACIRQATTDQLGYYVLGYSPREGTFEDRRRKAKFHRITVRVRRPGLRVRWTSGFSGVPDGASGTELAPAPKTREQQLLEALASPFKATGVKVRLTSLFYDRGKAGPNIRSLLFFDAKDLTFKQETDGWWHATVDIVTSAYRGVKPPIQQRQRVENIRLPGDLYRRALKEGFLFMLDDPMKEPGPFLIRVAVRDMASARVGSASQFVEVPDTRKGQLAISGISLNLASPQALKAQQNNPVPEGQNGKAEAWTEGGPAVRRYRPGQGVVYSFQVINPKLKGAKKTLGITTQMRVYRNGKLLFTGSPIALTEVGRLDDRRFVSGGILRLGTRLTPGEYLIQVTVTDKFAKKKRSQATQWVDLEVTETPKS